MASIAATFDPRRNSLNFLRLVFALAVVVSHTWPVGGYGKDPTLARQAIGTWAVAGFFAISGYLIANSRLHSSMGAFLIRRFLRIYPGYLVCLLVIAFAFATVGSSIGPGSVQWSSAISFVYRNLFLKVFQGGIDGTLTKSPYGPEWDGSLWTLIYEFLCYLAVGILLSLAIRWHRGLIIAAFVIVAAVATVETHRGNFGLIWAFTFLASIFFAGSLMALFADRIPVDWRLGILSILLAVGAAQLNVTAAVGAIPIAYSCLWLGIVLPFQKVGRKNDVSYGVYIYAFPAQQLIFSYLHGHRLPVGVAVLVCTAATIPLAIASWFLVEKPALALKTPLVRAYTARRRSPGTHRQPVSSVSNKPIASSAASSDRVAL